MTANQSMNSHFSRIQLAAIFRPHHDDTAENLTAPSNGTMRFLAR